MFNTDFVGGGGRTSHLREEQNWHCLELLHWLIDAIARTENSDI